MFILLGVVYNVFEAVDVVGLIRGGVYDDLGLTVGEVLKKRSPVSCALSLRLITYLPRLTGIPRHLHLFTERRTGHYPRHHSQVPRASFSGRG